MNKRIKELFRKYLANSCSEEELEEFLQFVRTSDQDETLRQVLQETFESVLLGSDTYVTKTGELVIPGSAKPFVVRHKKSRRPAILAIACVALVITVLGFYLLKVPQKSIQADAVAGMKKTNTERGEYKYILLSDSTQVWLNVGSTLEYPEQFDKSVREVSLTGEAYFDVKHAAERPFVIHTGEINTTVLGTAFDINAYADRKDVKVSVSRGKVKVSRGDELLATLLKNQEIKISQVKTILSRKVVSIKSIAAWQQGNILYDDESMSEIISDLQRVYNVDIRIEDQKIRSLMLSTRFRREMGISHALEILCRLTDTHLIEKNGVYIIQ